MYDGFYLFILFFEENQTSSHTLWKRKEIIVSEDKALVITKKKIIYLPLLRRESLCSFSSCVISNEEELFSFYLGTIVFSFLKRECRFSSKEVSERQKFLALKKHFWSFFTAFLFSLGTAFSLTVNREENCFFLPPQLKFLSVKIKAVSFKTIQKNVVEREKWSIWEGKATFSLKAVGMTIYLIWSQYNPRNSTSCIVILFYTK